MQRNDKKVIGIPGYKYEDKSFGCGISYLSLLNKFANVRIIMPWEEKVEVDLLFLPGGADINPATYGELPEFRTGNQDVFKEFFFNEHLKNYVEDTPIFGVCLGMQAIAVYFDSKLTQDLMFHKQSDKRWETAHTIYPEPYNKNEKKANTLEVNSHHHQCVLTSDLGPDLKALYTSDYEDGDIYGVPKSVRIVEVLSHKTLPIAGVQMHPEELYDYVSLGIIESLLEYKENHKAIAENIQDQLAQ